MSEERRRILDMLSEGKITADEAEKLLVAIEEPSSPEPSSAVAESGETAAPKYLRVVVEAQDGDRVNVRVPLQLIRAGVKLGALLPKEARVKLEGALNEKNIDFDLANLNPETVEELIQAMAQLQVDVNGKDKVRVFCE